MSQKIATYVWMYVDDNAETNWQIDGVKAAYSCYNFQFDNNNKKTTVMYRLYPVQYLYVTHSHNMYEIFANTHCIRSEASLRTLTHSQVQIRYELE